jgi:hypothetical protein
VFIKVFLRKTEKSAETPLLHEACQNNQFHVNWFVCVKALVLEIRKPWSAHREGGGIPNKLPADDCESLPARILVGRQSFWLKV